MFELNKDSDENQVDDEHDENSSYRIYAIGDILDYNKFESSSSNQVKMYLINKIRI